MTEITTIRTPQIVAAEINSIKQQTMTMVLCNSIEIGHRLLEAKSLVGHGEWGTWLKTSVDYSQRTASNLMRIFEEYGANQIALFGDNSKSQTLANLSYSQAVALLGVAEEDREEFVKENDLENLSVRQLQEAIKERDKALKENKDLGIKLKNTEKTINQVESERDKFRSENSDLKVNLDREDRINSDRLETIKTLQGEIVKERQRSKEDIERVKGLLEAAKSNGSSSEKVKQLEDELEAAQSKVQELTAKINEPITLEPTIIEKVPEDVERELVELREKAKELENGTGQQSDALIIKYRFIFESLVTDFKKLLGALAEIQEVDTEAHEKYKKTVVGLLGKMSESL